MQIKGLVFIFLLVIYNILYNTLYASVIPFSLHYFCQYNFPNALEGKSIKKVTAHTGDWFSSWQGEKKWKDVKDIPLKKINGHFFGKGEINSSGYSGSISSKNSPIVQYWLTFSDGSTQIEKEQFIPMLRMFNTFEADQLDLAVAISEFKALTDSYDSTCFGAMKL